MRILNVLILLLFAANCSLVKCMETKGPTPPSRRAAIAGIIAGAGASADTVATTPEVTDKTPTIITSFGDIFAKKLSSCVVQLGAALFEVSARNKEDCPYPVSLASYDFYSSSFYVHVICKNYTELTRDEQRQSLPVHKNSDGTYFVFATFTINEYGTLLAITPDKIVVNPQNPTGRPDIYTHSRIPTAEEIWEEIKSTGASYTILTHAYWSQPESDMRYHRLW
ncbi:hypothetical protein FJ366_00020 [Candidatus Dependentiae bacterium]|nr:hypothetical protein [Candidatus Dependentiae bacterium]